MPPKNAGSTKARAATKGSKAPTSTTAQSRVTKVGAEFVRTKTARPLSKKSDVDKLLPATNTDTSLALKPRSVPIHTKDKSRKVTAPKIEDSTPTGPPISKTKMVAKNSAAVPPVDSMDDAGVVDAKIKRKRAEVAAAGGNSVGAKAREVEDMPPGKKPKVAAALASSQKKFPKIGKKINHAPTAQLDVFVFGEGRFGELGLGSEKVDGKKPIDVKRPRLNGKLTGIVQVSCGGMHGVALTADNKILTWGVNDQGALGRDTTWKGLLKDADAGSDDEDEDYTSINPKESCPGPVDTSELDPDIRWVEIVASDSASFALTEDGRVYGWGTFRASDGILGFNEQNLVQKMPALIPDLKEVRQLVAGSNHILALDGKGKVQAWGCGQQNQLARRVFESHPRLALRPTSIGPLPIRGAKTTKLACGSYHSFALDHDGRVYAWGLNNYAELAIPDGAGEDDATQLKPRLVESLQECKIVDIDGGEHHSLACTDEGKLLTWGRIDGHQVGLAESVFTEENTIFDNRGKPRILTVPTEVPGLPPIVSVTAGTFHSLALTKDGRAYSWGFSDAYQTGQGTKDDIEVPTLIDNTAVRDRKLVFAGAGGQFSVLACESARVNEGAH